jgi:hypothetical protein
MTFKYINKTVFAAGLATVLFLTSCEKDLDRMPETEQTLESTYADFGNYKGVLAKIYGGLAMSGQEGGDGNPDISGIDGGTSNYLRQYFQMQELPTDEAIIAWNDGSLPDIHNMTWAANNEFIRAMYYRIYYQIAVTNEFIRETSDDKLSSRNITGQNAETARMYRNEARFMRALSYFHAIDLYGNGPFVTESTEVGLKPPPRIERPALFTYIENELKDLEGLLKDARTNEYGRADKAAVWMLLSKLYLNAEVYTGQARYSDARIYAEKVINAGYSLMPNYEHLFLADNNVGNNEVIFSVNFDGLHTRTFGGTTYIIHAGIGGTMAPANYGVNSGWGGLRSTKNIVDLFPDPDGSLDKRGRFHSDGQSLEINSVFAFTDGYPLIKFKNVKKDGTKGSDNTGDFVDTDFPLFRLGEAYLIYAEAVLRGGGGSTATAVQYINLLRQRAYGNTSGNVSTINLDFILDERARELAWEATRRTDLIRYGKFTSGSYTWPFKGGVKSGKAVEGFRVLYPIPDTDLIANPNLVQNTGY